MCKVIFNFSSEAMNTEESWNLYRLFIFIYGNLSIINSVIELKKVDYSNLSLIGHVIEFIAFENSFLKINNSILDFLESDEMDAYSVSHNLVSFYQRAPIQVYGADINLINNSIYNYYSFLNLSNSFVRIENNIIKSENACLPINYYYEFNLVAKLIEIKGNGNYYFVHNLFNCFNLNNYNIMTKSVFILDLNKVNNITFKENIFNTGRYFSYSFVNITDTIYLKLLNNLFLQVPFLVWNTQELSGLWEGNLFALTTSLYETFIDFDHSPNYEQLTILKNNFIDINEDYNLNPVILSFLKEEDIEKSDYDKLVDKLIFKKILIVGLITLV